MTPLSLQPVSVHCVDLAKSYGPVQAVRDVHLDVAAGQFLALLGPSGCGKTTVLRCIGGFEAPDEGRIQLGARTVASAATWIPPEQRHVGMVFQEYALFPHLSVEENIAFGLTRETQREERIHDMLRLVGLEGVRHRMPHELSGGQQQRVALARALAPRPGVVLLDEPFSNLDAALRGRVRQEVRDILRRAGVTVLFVTHDQEEALSLADQVAVMMEGRIIQVDRPERLYRRPATHQVATFLGEANFLPGKAKGRNVECALGTLDLHDELVGEVELMFRPEDLLLSDQDDGSAEIVDRTYFGHDQLLTVRLDSGTILRSRLVGCCRGLQPGRRVGLRIDTPVMAYPTPYGCPVPAQGPIQPGADTSPVAPKSVRRPHLS